VSGSTAIVSVPVTNAISVVVVVAQGNANGRQSTASASQSLLGMYAAPTFNSDAYSGTGPYTATLSYTVASGVTAVEVRKASDNSVISGVSALFSGTPRIATITVPFTDAIGIVVVALGNSGGLESAASASQMLIIPPPEVTAGTVSSAIAFKSTFGSQGFSIGTSNLNAPQGVAVDANNNIYVADGNNCIKKFNSTGTWSFTLGNGSFGGANGQFNNVSDVTIDITGNIYVADVNNQRIQVFSSSGTFLRNVGSMGTGNGQFVYPSGIALDKSMNIYVVDSTNNRVQVFDNNGNFLRNFGSAGTESGQFNNTSGIAVDLNGQIYVADKGNNRIQVFTNAGTVIRVITCTSPPKHLAVDGAGNIVVAVTDAVVIYNSLGVLQKTITGSVDNGQFHNPHGVAINSAGQLIVTSNNVHRVVILE
jgi:sugar lactone lactonase YvrE